MAQENVTRFSISLMIREEQIKTIIGSRYSQYQDEPVKRKYQTLAGMGGGRQQEPWDVAGRSVNWQNFFGQWAKPPATEPA